MKTGNGNGLRIRRLMLISFCFLALFVGAVVAIAGPPENSPVPRVIDFDGALEDQGEPAVGTYLFKFQLVDGVGQDFWESSERELELNGGRFSVRFPDAEEVELEREVELPDVVFRTRPLRLRISVARQGGSYFVLEPDVDINAVPFAVRSEHSENGVPPGTILPFGGTTAPDGYLLCDGSSVSQADYADLFAAIGTAWGTVDDGTHFNLPDLRGRFLRGHDGGLGRDPDAADRSACNAGGAEGDNVGSVQTDEFKSHNHVLSSIGMGNPVNDGSGTNTVRTDTSGNTGNSGGKETRPINAGVKFIVKY